MFIFQAVADHAPAHSLSLLRRAFGALTDARVRADRATLARTNAQRLAMPPTRIAARDAESLVIPGV